MGRNDQTRQQSWGPSSQHGRRAEPLWLSCQPRPGAVLGQHKNLHKHLNLVAGEPIMSCNDPKTSEKSRDMTAETQTLANAGTRTTTECVGSVPVSRSSHSCLRNHDFRRLDKPMRMKHWVSVESKISPSRLSSPTWPCPAGEKGLKHLLDAHHVLIALYHLNSTTILKQVLISTLYSQEKLRSRDFKQLAQGHTECKREVRFQPQAPKHLFCCVDRSLFSSVLKWHVKQLETQAS